MSKQLILAALCVALAGAAAAADFRSWNQRMAITFPGYTRAETLTNFPALVKLDESIPGFCYADFLSGGFADLRFTDDTLTRELSYDVERWDTNGTSLVWVRVPELSGSDTRIWAFWGKRDQMPLASTADGAVWSEGFLGVWHMDEIDARDASPNRFHGTAGGSTLPTAAVGQIGGAVAFTADLNYVTVPDSPLFTITSSYTVSAWIRSDPVGNAYEPIFGTFNGSTGFMLLLGNNVNNTLQFWTGGGFINSGKAIADDVWTHVAYTREGSTGCFYIDGTAVTTTTARNVTDGGVLRIGAAGSGWPTQRFDGVIDEVRLESVARGSNWMWACYLNAASNETFTARLVDPSATEVSSTSAVLNGMGTSADGGAADVRVHWGTTDGGSGGVWQQTALLGTSEPGLFVLPLADLAPNTWYFYTFSASNAAGVVWGDGSKMFKTLGPPVPTTTVVTEILRDRATLGGALADGTAADVWLEWWPVGVAATNTYSFGWLYERPLALDITGLSPATDYAFRLCASNAYGVAASEPRAFATPSVSAFYVALSGDDSSGASWATAFTSLQTAINAALPGDTIYLKGETFYTARESANMGQFVWTNKSLTILGGYAGADGAPGALTDAATVLANNSVPTTTPMTNRIFLISGVTNGTLARVTLHAGAVGNTSASQTPYQHYYGGGVYVSASSNLLFDTVVFDGNRVYGQRERDGHGGALYAAADTYGTLTNCTVRNNFVNTYLSSLNFGAGLHLAGGAWTVRDSVVRDNKILYNSYNYFGRGMGIYLAGGTHLIRNCVISRNMAERVTSQGDAIYVAAGSADIENCTIYWHIREGVRRAGTAAVTVRDSILWDNGDDLFGTVTLLNNNIEDGDSVGVDGNISVDPKFVRGLYLASDSPCVNAGGRSVGDAGLVGYTTRADGTADSGQVDMGYHYLPGAAARDWYVDAVGGSDANTGLVPESPFKTITRALAVVADGGHVHVAAGLYDLANGEVFPLALANRYGVQLLGSGRNDTIIDAHNANHRCLTMTYNYPDARVANLTLTRGRLVVLNVTSRGGGLYLNHVQGMIDDCAFIDNHLPSSSTWGRQGGAGLAGVDCDVAVTDCLVSGNTATAGWADHAYGGGIYAENMGTISHTTIVSNTVNVSGNSTFHTHAYGGGLYVSGNTTVRNCLIVRNDARTTSTSTPHGDGASVAAGIVVFDNCTVATNVTTAHERRTEGPESIGIERVDGTVTVGGSILWGNGMDVLGAVTVNWSNVGEADEATTLNYCISDDPRFIDAAADDYRLKVRGAGRSPSVNAGNPDPDDWMLTGFDLAGNPRILNRRVDQGAYENEVPLGGTVLMLR